MQQQKDSTTDKDDQVARVPRIPSDRPLGSTAPSIQPIPTFTAGPWFVFPGSAGVFNGCDVIFSEHVEDAIVCAMGHNLAGVNANARLIAAAPDLLEALRQAHDYLLDFGCDCGVDEPGTCALCQANTAIAKAIGGVA